MPGKLGRNLRQGHRTETGGIEVLRAICAVAQIPQSEDVGIDAVATILRESGPRFVAEDFFWVQFKASSVREVEYDEAAYKWLRGLVMPFFVGSFDLKSQTLALYTTHGLTCRTNADEYSSALLYLDPTERHERDVMHQHLGDPVVRFTMQQTNDPAFVEKITDTLAAWVRLEQSHIPLRKIRSTQTVHWTTNEPPSTSGTQMMLYANTLRQELEAIVPYLSKLSMLFRAQEKLTPEALGFMLLAEWFHANGVHDLEFARRSLVHRFGTQDLSLPFQVKKPEPD